MTPFGTRRFADRELLVDVSASPEGTLHQPGQVGQICQRADPAGLVAPRTRAGRHPPPGPPCRLRLDGATRRTPASGRTGRKPAASGGVVPAMGCGAAGRVAPLPGELTLSFLTRLAARYHLTIRDLLAAVTDVGGQQNLTGMLYLDSEIHLNAQARARVATLCRVPPRVLEQALPAWRREEPCGKYGAGPVGRLMRGEEAVAAWGPACPACPACTAARTAARTGRRVPARRYLTPGERVCARHRYWLLFLPGTSGLPVPLGPCPEVVDAQRRHVQLLRHCPAGAQAFEVARAITGSWRGQPWPDEEHLWPTRLEATRPAGADPGWWKVTARDLITHPETVVLARLLADRTVQERIITESRRHLDRAGRAGAASDYPPRASNHDGRAAICRRAESQTSSNWSEVSSSGSWPSHSETGSSAVIPNLLSYSSRRPVSRADCHSAREAAAIGISSGPSSSICRVTQPSASTSK